MERPAILYIHGKGGSPEEAAEYRSVFPDADVIGLAYRAETPWEAKTEFPALLDAACGGEGRVQIIANSIGAFFAMNALPQERISRAYFISPVVDMPRLIENMMAWAKVSEDELRERGTIETDFGQTLSWEYLTYVREHPIRWNVPTDILYGSADELTSRDVISKFAREIGASLTVMEQGGHWFHTEEQMIFLKRWLRATAIQ